MPSHNLHTPCSCASENTTRMETLWTRPFQSGQKTNMCRRTVHPSPHPVTRLHCDPSHPRGTCRHETQNSRSVIRPPKWYKSKGTSKTGSPDRISITSKKQTRTQTSAVRTEYLYNNRASKCPPKALFELYRDGRLWSLGRLQRVAGILRSYSAVCTVPIKIERSKNPKKQIGGRGISAEHHQLLRIGWKDPSPNALRLVSSAELQGLQHLRWCREGYTHAVLEDNRLVLV